MQSAAPTDAGNSTSSDDDSSGKNNSGKHKKKANVGAIVGGVVGGVVGACVVAVAALLILRHINLKREQERMEKEYQEAIKPVEYPENNELFPSPYSSNRDPSSGSFDEELRNKAMYPPATGTDPYENNDLMAMPDRKPSTNNHLAVANPFDDSRRISNGSLVPGSPPLGNNNVLTVVNPDETD